MTWYGLYLSSGAMDKNWVIFLTATTVKKLQETVETLLGHMHQRSRRPLRKVEVFFVWLLSGESADRDKAGLTIIRQQPLQETGSFNCRQVGVILAVNRFLDLNTEKKTQTYYFFTIQSPTISTTLCKDKAHKRFFEKLYGRSFIVEQELVFLKSFKRNVLIPVWLKFEQKQHSDHWSTYLFCLLCHFGTSALFGTVKTRNTKAHHHHRLKAKRVTFTGIHWHKMG